MDSIVLVVALITLVISLTTLTLLLFALFIKYEKPKRTRKATPTRKRKALQSDSVDSYTPSDVSDDTSNIESFEPDFSKPIKIKYRNEDEEKKFTTGDGEKLTPIESEDILERKEDGKG